MATPNRKEQFLIQQQIYKNNAFKLIDEMLGWCETAGAVPFMKELLHSIFFLGRICPVPFSPQEIFPNSDIYNALVVAYPDPPQHLSQFPKRTPFSSAMDMVILKLGPHNETQIMSTLKSIVEKLEENFPVSTTVCVSQRSSDSPRHYGVSMSTTSCNPEFQVRKMMIAASCCGPWDEYVAGAVMKYLPKAVRGRGNPDFDGRIKLPAFVRCDAFDIRQGTIKNPCKSCGDMFGLPTTEIIMSPHGNCAEAESLSNLFKEDAQVKNGVIRSPKGTDGVRSQIRSDIMKQLQNILHAGPYRMDWKGDFYNQ